MRIAITGATGNIGTSLVQAMQEDARFESIVGISRRRPAIPFPKVTWATADIERDDLVPHLAGADVVVHLAWRIQPSHREHELWLTNVEG